MNQRNPIVIGAGGNANDDVQIVNIQAAQPARVRRPPGHQRRAGNGHCFICGKFSVPAVNPLTAKISRNKIVQAWVSQFIRMQLPEFPIVSVKMKGLT